MKSTRHDNTYTFEHEGVVRKLMVRAGRGAQFLDAPRDLMGNFPTVDAAAKAFRVYADRVSLAEHVRRNPLTPADPDIAKGTILDERISKYGMPPTTRKAPPSLDADAALARLKKKLGPPDG